MTLTLWEVKNQTSLAEFDRKTNIGLHHLALRLASEDALVRVFWKVSQWPGVRV